MEILYNETQFYLLINIIIWLTFFIFAEYKKDFIYFLVLTIIDIELGVFLLMLSNDILNYMFGVIFIMLAIWHSALMFVSAPALIKRIKEFIKDVV